MGLDYVYLNNTTRTYIKGSSYYVSICLLLAPKDPLKYVVTPITYLPTYLSTYLHIYIYQINRDCVMILYN